MSIEAKTLPSAMGLGIGAMLVLLSAVAWSLAGPLTKGVSADVWAVLAWRGLISGVAILVYVAWRSRDTVGDLRRMGWSGWLATAIGSVATVAFIGSFKLTAVAHVVVIYGTAPFWAAGVAWLWFRERTSNSVLIASAVALLGVAVVVSGTAGGGATLTGDALALAMTVGMAVMMVMIRRYPAAPMVLAAGISSGLLLIVGLVVGQAVGGADPLAIPSSEIAILAGFGVLHAGAVVLLTEGTRLIPASEAALLGAMEVPMAPLWAWVLLGERLSGTTVLGGGAVLAALLWHLRRRAE